MLIKNKQDIDKIMSGGKIIGEILYELGKMCKPGISAWDIDKKAEELILKSGGRPAFKGYRGSPSDTPFPCTICASLNHELVHGIATKKKILSDGDLFSIDIGMEYQGCFTDTAITVAIGEIRAHEKKLMKVTKESLEVGIRAVKPGNTVADIGRAIENYVKAQGNYGIVRDLVGHGVGHAVHEDPRIPNYYEKNLERWVLKPGMVLAIEPMISLGTYRVVTGKDGWTIEMADGSWCAHFEHTVIVTEKGCKVATRRPDEHK